MVLVCGRGGVGKTTMAAALAATAATHLGGRVLVLTVDPARRLADALGIGALGNTATRVPDEAFAAAGVEPRGELWAAMLDTKAGWDELIRRHAPDAKVREAVLANPLYQSTSRAASSTATTTSRWSSSTSCTRRAATTWSWSTRRRRAARSTCSTRRADEGVLR